MDQLALLSEAELAEVEGGAPAGPVVEKLFRTVAARYADDRALKAAAGRLDLDAHLDAAPGSTVRRAVEALTMLIESSVAAGELRAGVTLDDIVMMLDGVPGREVPEAMRERYVDIVIAGLTART